MKTSTPQEREWAEGEQDVLRYISDTPALLSMLYDLDLLPEQHPDPESKEREQIFIITNHWREDHLSERGDSTAAAIARMRNYPDGSYMRCPFCGCKSSTHEPDCPIEIVANAAPQVQTSQEQVHRADAFPPDKQETPFKLPLRVRHWNTPLADTGDYEGHTAIEDARGDELGHWSDASDWQEQVISALVNAANAALSATRESVLEEAAKVCAQMRPILVNPPNHTLILQRDTLDNAARLIRALKQTRYVKVCPKCSRRPDGDPIATCANDCPMHLKTPDIKEKQ